MSEDISLAHEIPTDQVVLVQVSEILDGKAKLNIRLRGNNNWLFFRDLEVKIGKSVIIHDICDTLKKSPDDYDTDYYVAVPRTMLDERKQEEVSNNG